MSDYLRRYQENTGLLSILKIIVDIAMVMISAFVLVSFSCVRTNMSGNSMAPVVQNNDTVMINRFCYGLSSPDRFDIIAFSSDGTLDHKIYIKRIIGLPGDKVQIKDGKVYINDELLTNDVFTDNILTAGLAGNAIKLGKDEYFVLGDNRNNSEDSRFANIGRVKREEIIGKIWMIISPVSRFQLL